jgi:hypothetical protein
MTMIEMICWLQNEEEALEEMVYGSEKLAESQFLIKLGRLEEVRKILRKLQKNGMI